MAGMEDRIWIVSSPQKNLISLSQIEDPLLAFLNWSKIVAMFFFLTLSMSTFNFRCKEQHIYSVLVLYMDLETLAPPPRPLFWNSTWVVIRVSLLLRTKRNIIFIFLYHWEMNMHQIQSKWASSWKVDAIRPLGWLLLITCIFFRLPFSPSPLFEFAKGIWPTHNVSIGSSAWRCCLGMKFLFHLRQSFWFIFEVPQLCLVTGYLVSVDFRPFQLLALNNRWTCRCK